MYIRLWLVYHENGISESWGRALSGQTNPRSLEAVNRRFLPRSLYMDLRRVVIAHIPARQAKAAGDIEISPASTFAIFWHKRWQKPRSYNNKSGFES